jgi:hypothetical protein
MIWANLRPVHLRHPLGRHQIPVAAIRRLHRKGKTVFDPVRHVRRPNPDHLTPSTLTPESAPPRRHHAVVGELDGAYREFVDAGEVVTVAGVDGQTVGDGRSGDQRVVGTRLRLAS